MAHAASEPTTPRLSREVLIEACLRIADREGPQAVTMRRLGSELGVDPTAVYRHFRDKAELLIAMADRLLIETLEGFAPSGSWRTDLKELAIRARRTYLAHPRLAFLVAAADAPLPSESRISELALGTLRSAGLPDADAVLAFQAIEGYTAGTSSLDAASGPDGGDAWRRAFAALPKEEFPNLSSTAALMYREDEAAFEFGLDLMLDALEARLPPATG
jgi:AcrR family transcriptional regulator